jgi:hypothetical protein
MTTQADLIQDLAQQIADAAMDQSNDPLQAYGHNVTLLVAVADQIGQLYFGEHDNGVRLLSAALAEAVQNRSRSCDA